MLAVAGGVAVSRSRNGSSGLKSGLSGKKVMKAVGGGGNKALKAVNGKQVMKAVKKADLSKAVKKVDLPDADEAIDWIEDKAKVLGDAGYKVAEASSQARSAKKAVSGS